MTLNFEHSLRGSSIRGAHVRALYALFVGALSFLILTATMVFYSIMTPSAYAETSSTGGDTSYYEEVFTLDEATGEIEKVRDPRRGVAGVFRIVEFGRSGALKADEQLRQY